MHAAIDLMPKESELLPYLQVEILLSGLWDPSSGNLFAEEGDQQRFWKITRKFVEQVSSTCGAAQVKAVSRSCGAHGYLTLQGWWRPRRPFLSMCH
jgi:hypothetical protein